MKIKKSFFVFSFLFILIPTIPVFAGSLYGPSLQGIAYKQGWMADYIGGTCKYREPNNSELQELNDYCKNTQDCVSTLKNYLTNLKDCGSFGKVVGKKDFNVVYEPITPDINTKNKIPEVKEEATIEKQSFSIKNLFFNIINFFKRIIFK
ncbi:MAG: hypothetical protein WC349_03855 [Patescibacteria group bacterium]|jgi:hypothetical protein